jgi:hypothetical protein
VANASRDSKLIILLPGLIGRSPNLLTRGRIAESQMSQIRKEKIKWHHCCFKCGDKWGKGHTCPTQVPLHDIEEMILAIQ